jgi:hypothetical protein
MSKLEKMDWLNETNTNIAEAISWLKIGAMQTMFGQGGQVTFTTADDKSITGTINENGDVVTKEGVVYRGKNISMDIEGNLTSGEFEKPASTEPEKKPWNYSYPMPSTGSQTLKKGSTGDRVKGL